MSENSKVFQQTDSFQKNSLLKDEYYDDKSKTVEGQNKISVGSKETSEQDAGVKQENSEQDADVNQESSEHLMDNAKDDIKKPILWEVSEKREDKKENTNKDEDKNIQNNK